MTRSLPVPPPMAERKASASGLGVDRSDPWMHEEPQPGLALLRFLLDQLVVGRRSAKARR